MFILVHFYYSKKLIIVSVNTTSPPPPQTIVLKGQSTIFGTPSAAWGRHGIDIQLSLSRKFNGKKVKGATTPSNNYLNVLDGQRTNHLLALHSIITCFRGFCQTCDIFRNTCVCVKCEHVKYANCGNSSHCCYLSHPGMPACRYSAGFAYRLPTLSKFQRIPRNLLFKIERNRCKCILNI